MRQKGKLLVSVVLALLVLGIGDMVYAAISPTTINATLAPGESITETKTVEIPEVPPKVDVVFAFDLTGSMRGIINTTKNKSTTIMTGLDALGVDINYGVMSYMDYPHNYSSYGYSAYYGYSSCGDYAYSLDQAVTNNQSAVTTSINGLMIGCGADGPQDYTRIFYESYADPSVGWRSGAKKILVNFGDNVPHDNNLNEGVTTGNWSTGGDPGRDEVMFTADDLDLQTVLANMAANNVVLLESHTSNYTRVYWDYWTGITSGATFITGSTTLVDDVVNAITAELTAANVTNLHLEASSGYESWLESVTPVSYSGPTNVTVEFELTIKVPEGTPDGIYTFTISALDDADVSYGDQEVTIEVKSAISVCNVFLTPKKVNVNRNTEHSFKVHVYPCEAMNVSVGDEAEVTVNCVPYDAIVSSTDVDGAATDIAIKVYMGDALEDNDPTVAIYSINSIAISYPDGSDIDDLVLNTFTGRKK